MTMGRWTRTAWWAAVALAACALLALRDVAASAVQSGLDPRLYPSTTGEKAAWEIAYYLMWAALTPLIFAAARRVPFRRRRWLPPLAFHLLTSVVVSASAPVVLGILFGAVVRGYAWPDASELVSPVWTRLAAYRALADTSIYWMILAAGFTLRAYDLDQGRQQQAADLKRALVVAQVDALKLKLQPHFLFNTLNSISFLAVERDTTGVVTMVERLSALLRSSMQATGSQLVTVQDELALLDQYLAIEEIRFADRLRVVRCVEPAVMNALIPSLVLQPVIENSIKHGFSRRIDASRLEIAVRREGDTLVVDVRDDGPGLPPGWDIATRCGRGLKNVIERLDKLYPGAWAFTLIDAPGGGALATVRMPFQEQPNRRVFAGSAHS
jgi:two-component system, LytTR family, sensor kinase